MIYTISNSEVKDLHELLAGDNILELVLISNSPKPVEQEIRSYLGTSQTITIKIPADVNFLSWPKRFPHGCTT